MSTSARVELLGICEIRDTNIAQFARNISLSDKLMLIELSCILLLVLMGFSNILSVILITFKFPAFLPMVTFVGIPVFLAVGTYRRIRGFSLTPFSILICIDNQSCICVI